MAVGGRGYLHGAILGAVLVNYAKSWLTGAAPEIWLFFLGGLFIAVTVFLPKGIIGSLEDVSERLQSALPGRGLRGQVPGE